MLQALDKSMGIVSRAAEAIGINRSSHYRWMNSDEEYREQVESINEKVIDIAEHHLLGQITGGNISAIIFFLKTKGKKRGYVERQELTGKDGGPLEHKNTFDISHISEEEQEAILNILERNETR